ncbi:chorismate mutase [Variovorax sp. KK3]|uniref:chorismate mutase n=1 Tax=Variovorax sp. KK3 TaxID=1855728 RepID=UPI00097C8A82|nr:chorismate mutase [Variovorax sp. KK3]
MEDPAKSLAELRAEIDALDDQFCSLLANRLTLTDAVGRCKALTGEPPEDPQRQRRRKKLLEALAVRHRLPRVLVQGLFGLIKEEVVARHMATARRLGCVQGGRMDCP